MGVAPITTDAFVNLFENPIYKAGQQENTGTTQMQEEVMNQGIISHNYLKVART